MVKATVAKKLLKYRKLLEHEGIHVKEMIVYGSRVSGKFKPESDIDVCVVVQSLKVNRIQEGTRLHLLALQVDPLIEPVVFSLEQYRKDKTSPLLHEIREKGIKVA